MKKLVFALAILFCVSIVGCTKQEKNFINTTERTQFETSTTQPASATTMFATTTKEQSLQNTFPSTTQTELTEHSNMSIDYSFIKEFKSVEQYKQEFLKYKSFDDVKKSVGYKNYPDNYLKIDKSYASMMLEDKFFLALNSGKLNLKQIKYQLEWAYVSCYYEVDSEEVVIGYCTSKEMAKSYNFLKEKPDIITENGCELHLTKRSKPQYSWYNEEFDTAFYMESKLFDDKKVLLDCINDITIEKINIV